MRKAIVTALCVLSGGSVPAQAESSFAEPPSLEARFVPTSPVIDGHLDEEAWTKAEAAKIPADRDGQVSSVRFLWSEDGLYFGFEGVDSTPFQKDREPSGSLHTQDVVELFIDPVGDSMQYIEVQISLSGASFFQDYVLSAPPQTEPTGALTREFFSREWWPRAMPEPAGFVCVSRHDATTHRWVVEGFLPTEAFNRRRGGKPLQPGPIRLNIARHDWKESDPEGTLLLYWSEVIPGWPHLSPARMGTLQLAPAAEE